MSRYGTRPRGFTLIEMAVALVVVGSLAAAALAPLRVQLEARARRATAATLDQALDGLYGHAAMHGRLPCPDVSGDGSEDRVAGDRCARAAGLLPHLELGVRATDAWGNRLRYAVTTAAGFGATASFTARDDGLCRADDGDLDLCERGTLEILARGDDPRTAARETKRAFRLADGVPAIVLSHGANGHGATRADGRPASAVPARNRDEGANAEAGPRFFARGYSAPRDACGDDANEATPLCGFDDLLRWVSPTVLAARLVAAGRLP